jgi:hypothetical protein
MKAMSVHPVPVEREVLPVKRTRNLLIATVGYFQDNDVTSRITDHCNS